MNVINVLKQCLLAMIFVNLIMPSVNAAIKSYEGYSEYYAAKNENVDNAKEQARKLALRDVQEQVFTYVKNYSKSVKSQLTQDEVETITLGIMNVDEAKYDIQRQTTGEYTVIAKIKAKVDTNKVAEWFERVKQADKDVEKMNIAVKKRPSVRTNETFKSDNKIKEGDAFYYKQDYNRAVSIYTEAIEIDNRNDYAYYSRALAYIKLEKYKEATDDMNAAIKRNPYEGDYYNVLAEIYIHLKNYNRVIAYSTKALEYAPDSYEAYYNRGIAYYNLQEYDNASADLKKAVELKSDYAEAKQMLAKIKS